MSSGMASARAGIPSRAPRLPEGGDRHGGVAVAYTPVMRSLAVVALTLTPLLLGAGQPWRTESVTSSRAAALAAVQRAWPSEATLKRCGPGSPDTKTSRLAFAVGRPDLLLLETGGRALAFRTPGNGTARLLWCGAFAPPGQKSSVLGGSAARALAFGYRSGWGTFPRETAPFDTYTGFAQQLTVSAGQPRNGRPCAHTYNLIGSGLAFPSAGVLRFGCDGTTTSAQARP